jgi:hypothetical protein
VRPLVTVIDNSHHHIIEFGDNKITGCYVNFTLIDFGAGLIESLSYIFCIEHNKIGRRFADNSDNLIPFNQISFSCVFTDYVLTYDNHYVLPDVYYLCFFVGQQTSAWRTAQLPLFFGR